MADTGGKLGAMRQTLPQRIEYGPEAVAKLTDKELYGYEPDKSFAVHSSNKRATTYMPKPVAMLARAKGDAIKPVCTALLRRFKIIGPDETITRGGPFTGAGTSDEVRPEEIKCAVLMLLGMNIADAKEASDYGANKPLHLSATFNSFIKKTERDRLLYPLKHPGDFPELAGALDWMAQCPGVDVEHIFKTNRIPLLHPVDDEHTYIVPLGAVLSVMGRAAEGMTVEDISGSEHGSPAMTLSKTAVENLLSGSASPFSPAVLAWVGKRRTEKQTQKSDPEKPRG
ncbi:MAG: hypothetical protein Q8Q13_00020 [bacterium]|nr:hypothetical protein [bacterium]